MLVRLLAGVILVLGVASAQGGKKGGSSNKGDDSGMMMRPQRQTPVDVIADKLKLNKDQKAEVVNILSAGREAAGQLGAQIGQGRNVIAQAIVQGKSEDELKQMMTQYTDLLAKMTNVEAVTYGKIYALLKPNQQSKAAGVFDDQMTGMFMGGGGRRAQ